MMFRVIKFAIRIMPPATMAYVDNRNLPVWNCKFNQLFLQLQYLVMQIFQNLFEKC